MTSSNKKILPALCFSSVITKH